MKKNLYISVFASLLVLAGCDDYNEKYFGDLDPNTRPTDVKNIEYMLTDADYATISTNSTNVNLAKSEGTTKELGDVKTDLHLSQKITAAKYIPAFLAGKWYAADKGSSVKLTYQMKGDMPEYLTPLNAASIYKVSNDDYEKVWDASFPFFSPTESASKHIPAILASAFPNAEANDIMLVDYNISENEPGGAVTALNENFEEKWTETVYTAEIEGWNNVITKGTYAWSGRIYKNDCYIQASAFGHKAGENEAYMITPRISVVKDMHLTFDGYYYGAVEAGGKLSLLISEDLANFTPESVAAAKWTDISNEMNLESSTSTSGTFKNACDFDLSAYAGKKIYIAFRYWGNNETGATTGIRLDNVVVKSEGSGSGDDTYVATAGLYQFDETKWTPYTGAYAMTKADFKSMGSNYDNFSASMDANHYLPVFLKLKYPYAQVDDVQAVVYKYFANSKTTVRADEYIYNGTEWIKNTAIETMVDQFVFDGSKWNYDPSMVITLTAGKGQQLSATYYQTITDYVWESIDQPAGATKKGEGYVTSYGNNDYYYGCSAYQNNFDFRPAAWKAQNNVAYGSMSDSELTDLMFKRLPEAFIPALEKIHADAKMIEGIDITYTIKFAIYNGTSTDYWKIVYKLVGPGKFEYVEESLVQGE